MFEENLDRERLIWLRQGREGGGMMFSLVDGYFIPLPIG